MLILKQIISDIHSLAPKGDINIARDLRQPAAIAGTSISKSNQSISYKYQSDIS